MVTGLLIGAIVVFAALGVLFWRKKQHQDAVAAGAIIPFLACIPLSIPTWLVWTFFLVWAAALIYTVINHNPAVAYGLMLGVTLTGIALPAAVMALTSPASQNVPASSQSADTNQPANMQLVVNRQQYNAENPVVGSEALQTPPSLPNAQATPITSWRSLINFVNSMPGATWQNYINSWNSLSKIGDWATVQGYADREEQESLELRVILIINSSVSDQQARNDLRASIGDVADKLPVVRIDNVALLNTLGVDTNGTLRVFADLQSQIRVLLTRPTEDGRPNLEEARKGLGLLTECANITTGTTIPPQRETPPPPKETTSTTTPPVTTTTTVPPTTTTSTTPPVTTTSTTPPVTTTTETTSTTTSTTTVTTTTPPVTTTTTPPVTTTTLVPKDPNDSHPSPTGAPTAPPHTEPAEATPPGPVTTTQTVVPTTTQVIPAPIDQAPSPEEPGSGDMDPDSNKVHGASMSLLALLALLLASRVRVRRENEAA